MSSYSGTDAYVMDVQGRGYRLSRRRYPAEHPCPMLLSNPLSVSGLRTKTRLSLSSSTCCVMEGLKPILTIFVREVNKRKNNTYLP